MPETAIDAQRRRAGLPTSKSIRIGPPPRPPAPTPVPASEVEVIEPPSEDLAFRKAIDAVAKAFLSGNAAKMPGTSWSNQGTINTALIARVTQDLAASFGKAPEELEVALAEHGLSWGPPFPPAGPSTPSTGTAARPGPWTSPWGRTSSSSPGGTASPSPP